MIKVNQIRKFHAYDFFVVTKIFKKAGNDWCSCRELKNGTIYDLGYHYIENYSVVMDG